MKKKFSLFILSINCILLLTQCKKSMHSANKGFVTSSLTDNFLMLLDNTYYKIEDNNVILKLETYIYPQNLLSFKNKNIFIRMDDKNDYLTNINLSNSENGYDIFSQTYVSNFKYTFVYSLPIKDYFKNIDERRDCFMSDMSFNWFFNDILYTIGTYQLDIIK